MLFLEENIEIEKVWQQYNRNFRIFRMAVRRSTRTRQNVYRNPTRTDASVGQKDLSDLIRVGVGWSDNLGSCRGLCDTPFFGSLRFAPKEYLSYRKLSWTFPPITIFCFLGWVPIHIDVQRKRVKHKQSGYCFFLKTFFPKNPRATKVCDSVGALYPCAIFWWRWWEVWHFLYTITRRMEIRTA